MTTKEKLWLFVCREAVESKLVKLDTSGQSYKHFTIVIYDSRVARLGNCPCYDSRVVNYDHKMFIRLATAV